MNNRAIRNPPKGGMETADVHWIKPLEELYALLPSDVLDTSVQPTIPKVHITLPILRTPIFQLLWVLCFIRNMFALRQGVHA